jgi:hypothetical protein
LRSPPDRGDAVSAPESSVTGAGDITRDARRRRADGTSSDNRTKRIAGIKKVCWQEMGPKYTFSSATKL